MLEHDHSSQAAPDSASPTDPEPEGKGWYCRGYLPHYDDPRVLQSITFRLSDSLPRHVHALIKPHTTLSKIVQSWKAYVGRWALQRNEALDLKIPGGAFWMEDYWDRFIRDSEHLADTRQYIRNNPVRAGLCRRPEDWKWSSAGYRQ